MSKTQSDNIRVRRDREFCPHHILIGAANLALDRAKKKEPGWLYDQLVAMTFSAMALEALANAFGERLVERWKDFESANPIAKLRIVATRLKIPEPVLEKDPWDFALWLIRFRNKVAHAKPESVSIDTVMSRSEFEQRRFELPEAKLEREISLENAERALMTVEAIFKLLWDHTPQEEWPGLLGDSFSGTVSAEQTDIIPS